jgi:hypothetical protein
MYFVWFFSLVSSHLIAKMRKKLFACIALVVAINLYLVYAFMKDRDQLSDEILGIWEEFQANESNNKSSKLPGAI